MKKSISGVAGLLIVLILAMSLCGCFSGNGALEDKDKVCERLKRRDFTVNTYEDLKSGDQLVSFSLHMKGLPDSTNVDFVIYVQNPQTHSLNPRPDGSYPVILTTIFIAYCADEETAKKVCANAKSSMNITCEIYETQGKIAYWGDKYAYEVATKDKMLWSDGTGNPRYN